jgi:2-polyprenyl-3-methyl-5-hydroxy-6-metoxy-1,4-benzoquinol methylase
LPAGGALLDIGAGPGHLGAAVAGHFGYVAGVEADVSTPPPPGVYHRWVAGAADPAAVWERSFDAIVFADVLEHLGDPAPMLLAARRWIAPGGLLLVSLPNVANVTVRISLLAGRFEYADRGILDRTHLRFFTRRSARRAIEAAGFRIARVRATPVPAELALPALGRPPWSVAVRAMASGAARILPTLFGYQFVFFAHPE